MSTERAEHLLEILRASSGRVIDTFKRWDTDLSGAIDKKEWKRGLLHIAQSKDAEVPPREEIEALFDAIDIDKSGQLELKELEKILRPGYGEVLSKRLQVGGAGEIEVEAKNRGHALRKRDKAMPHEAGAGERFEYSSLGGGTATAHARTLRGADLVKEGTQTVENAHKLEMTLDLESGESPEVQLRTALAQNAVRVIDLFKDWDTSGDGRVSRKEFVRGVGLLGFPGGEAAAHLFDEWDEDGSRTIEMRELNRVLRRGKDMSGVDGRRAVYSINTSSRRNWSRKRVDGASGVVLHVRPEEFKRGSRGKMLQARPPASPDHKSWRAAGAALPHGRMSPPPFTNDLILHGVESLPWRLPSNSSPPRRPEQVVADLSSKRTEASRLRTAGREGRGRRSGFGMRVASASASSERGSPNGASDVIGSSLGGDMAFLPRVQSASAIVPGSSSSGVGDAGAAGGVRYKRGSILGNGGYDVRGPGFDRFGNSPDPVVRGTAPRVPVHEATTLAADSRTASVPIHHRFGEASDIKHEADGSPDAGPRRPLHQPMYAAAGRSPGELLPGSGGLNLPDKFYRPPNYTGRMSLHAPADGVHGPGDGYRAEKIFSGDGGRRAHALHSHAKAAADAAAAMSDEDATYVPPDVSGFFGGGSAAAAVYLTHVKRGGSTIAGTSPGRSAGRLGGRSPGGGGGTMVLVGEGPGAIFQKKKLDALLANYKRPGSGFHPADSA